MAYNMKKELDSMDWKILKELQADGRISLSELSQKVALSRPSVTERVRRLEEGGVITGYRAVVDYKALGYPITAYLKVSIGHGYYNRVMKRIRDIPEAVECYRIAGDDDIIVKVISDSVEYYARVIDDLLLEFRDCNFVTFIVMETFNDFDLIRLQPLT